MIVFIVLALVNIVPLFILPTRNRFWIISIPLWISMMAGFIRWRINSSKETQALEMAYKNSAGNRSDGDFKIWMALKKLEQSNIITNQKILNTIFFQTFLMWIFQMIGLRKTKTDYYFWLSWLTGILFLATFILEALMGVVPTGPMI